MQTKNETQKEIMNIMNTVEDASTRINNVIETLQMFLDRNGEDPGVGPVYLAKDSLEQLNEMLDNTIATMINGKVEEVYKLITKM